ncbi:MAG: hypothetical protein KBG47_11310 [Bacteroidia bacterium]|nr:hypothetical protein [Sphingobacteriaceae bacterium]MBP9070088.1 hypothetical protein [Bacteroidia bacterium]
MTKPYLKSSLAATFLLAFILNPFNFFAQEGNPIQDLGSSVHGNFQIDAQYYNPDSLIGAPKVPEKLLSNAFGNINFIKGKFSAGVRYEAYNNVKQGFLPQYKGQGITNRFVRYQDKLFDVTVGNFYEMFGNGLTLRTYYEPGLLYDNSLDGARIISNPYKGITLKGVIGKQRYFFTVGPGIVRGVDGEININELFDSIITSKTKFIIGGSFVSKFQTGQDPNLILPENVGCYSGRFNIIRDGFNLGAEYAYKINDPSADNKLSYKYGDALYVTTSYAGDGYSFLFQGKRIDNMSYRSDRAESLQNLLINYLPATTKQHAYTLLALNPYATQLNGELGFMAEAQYKIKKGTPLGGKYGVEITVNYSQAHGLKQYSVSDSAGGRTFYETKWDFKEISGKKHHVDSVLRNGEYTSQDVSYNDNYRYYQDFFIEINKKFNKKVKATFMYSHQFYNRNIIQAGSLNAGYKNLNSDLFLLDITYKYKPGSAIRFETQFLLTPAKDVVTTSNGVGRGNWATGMIEWSINSNFFVAVFDQWNYGNPQTGSESSIPTTDLRIHYYLFNAGYNSGPHRLAISYGKQSAGIFCVGGVCRNVPASNGLSLSLTSSF